MRNENVTIQLQALVLEQNVTISKQSENAQLQTLVLVIRDQFEFLVKTKGQGVATLQKLDCNRNLMTQGCL